LRATERVHGRRGADQRAGFDGQLHARETLGWLPLA